MDFLLDVWLSRIIYVILFLSLQESLFSLPKDSFQRSPLLRKGLCTVALKAFCIKEMLVNRLVT